MPGLGRIYSPDERDWPAQRLEGALTPHAHSLPAKVLWTDTQVLDQGEYGTCVGNGWAGWGDSEPILDTFLEPDARKIYFEATVIDGHPDDPDAPGGGQRGSTVRSGAKAMKNRSRLGAYAFISTIAEMRDWLANHGPIVMGTDWTNDMFKPNAAGFVAPTGGVAGGHCYLCIGYDTANDSFRFRNSWGKSWALSGDFLMKSGDVTRLLANQGEACIAAELDQPPTPGPMPTPAKDGPTWSDEKAFIQDLLNRVEDWLKQY